MIPDIHSDCVAIFVITLALQLCFDALFDSMHCNGTDYDDRLSIILKLFWATCPARQAGSALKQQGDGDLAYFTVWCPSGMGLEKAVLVEGTRWRIEEDVSERPGMNLALITMRPGSGTDGIVMYHSSCWPVH